MLKSLLDDCSTEGYEDSKFSQVEAFTTTLADILDLSNFKEDLRVNIQVSFFAQALVFALKHRFTAEEGASFLALARILLTFLVSKVADNATPVAQETVPVAETAEVSTTNLIVQLVEFYRKKMLQLSVVPNGESHCSKSTAPVFDLEKMELLTTGFLDGLISHIRLYQQVFRAEQAEQFITVTPVIPRIPDFPALAGNSVLPEVWQEQQLRLTQEAELKKEQQLKLELEKEREEANLLEQRIAEINFENQVNPLEHLSQQQINQVVLDVVNTKVSQFAQEFDRNIAEVSTVLLSKLHLLLTASVAKDDVRTL